MRNLPKPVYDPGDVFMSCIGSIRNRDFKRRLISCTASIAESETEFDEKCAEVELHTIATSDNVNGVLTVEEMVAIYNARMVKKGSPGRPVYDAIITAPVFGRCPLCGLRSVSTLDHHLAKTLYPALAVCPYNLIPSCAECNKTKRNIRPLSAEDETLNPYYDNIDGVEWLVAEVVENCPPSVVFSILPSDEWDDLLTARVQNHFEILELNSLYSINAANVLLNRRRYFTTLHDRGGVNEVYQYIIDTYESYREVNINSWQSALYKSLFESDWFCDGGFIF
jgi:hypothetical protein